MARLAIKGHLTRGKEVIEILEMLGGINLRKLEGTDHNSHYTIDNDGTISGTISAYLCKCDNHVYYTIEEFLEKFPYKVGDEVQRHIGATPYGTVYEIEQMKWEDDQVKYIICDLYWKNIKCTVTIEDLQPYKEEIMEEVYAYNEINCYHQDFGDKVRIRLGNDFEIKVEDNITYIVKKKPQYPKTYEECCDVLKIPKDERYIDIDVPLDYNKLLATFTKLLICRDAYWKIAGEEMGLDKPWEPDGGKNNGVYYIFYCVSNGETRLTAGNLYSNEVFAFPTKEMRNAFFENFKELIEIVKELL